MPAWAYFAGVIGHVTLLSLLLVVVVVLFGALFYDVEVPGRTLPAFALTVLLGAAAFSALGLALTGLIRDADAAPAIVNASVLPLLFISDVFITPGNAPEWLSAIRRRVPGEAPLGGAVRRLQPLRGRLGPAARRPRGGRGLGRGRRAGRAAHVSLGASSRMTAMLRRRALVFGLCLVQRRGGRPAPRLRDAGSARGGIPPNTSGPGYWATKLCCSPLTEIV